MTRPLRLANTKHSKAAQQPCFQSWPIAVPPMLNTRVRRGMRVQRVMSTPTGWACSSTRSAANTDGARRLPRPSSPDASVSTNLGRWVKAVRPRGDGQHLQGGTDPVDLQLSPKGHGRVAISGAWMMPVISYPMSSSWTDVFSPALATWSCCRHRSRLLPTRCPRSSRCCVSARAISMAGNATTKA
jgi:hypothetical protein